MTKAGPPRCAFQPLHVGKLASEHHAVRSTLRAGPVPGSGQTPSMGAAAAPGEAPWAPKALSPAAAAVAVDMDVAEEVAEEVEVAGLSGSAADPAASAVCPVTSLALILMALTALVAPVCSTIATARRMIAR